jgi:hypothetical protein
MKQRLYSLTSLIEKVRHPNQKGDFWICIPLDPKGADSPKSATARYPEGRLLRFCRQDELRKINMSRLVKKQGCLSVVVGGCSLAMTSMVNGMNKKS